MIGERAVTLLSYNIRNGHPSPGHEWADRRALVAEIIRRNDPDLLTLQEVLRGQLDDLAASVDGYESAGVSRLGTDEDEYGPVLWRSHVFERVDDGQFWFSDTPDVPGSNGWGMLYPRFATWVRLRRRSNGAMVTVACLHLDHEEGEHGEVLRIRCLRLLHDRLAGGEPLLVGGDLNSEPSSATHRALGRLGLRDCADDVPDRDHGARTVGSFHDYEPWRIDQRRIDGILHSDGVDTEAQWVDAADETARLASDHMAVVARLRL